MKKNREIQKLKEEIEVQREELNKIVVQSKNKEKIIRISEKLDVLISQYYSINSNKKIAE